MDEKAATRFRIRWRLLDIRPIVNEALIKLLTSAESWAKVARLASRASGVGLTPAKHPCLLPQAGRAWCEADQCNFAERIRA